MLTLFVHKLCEILLMKIAALLVITIVLRYFFNGADQLRCAYNHTRLLNPYQGLTHLTHYFLNAYNSELYVRYGFLGFQAKPINPRLGMPSQSCYSWVLYRWDAVTTLLLTLARVLIILSYNVVPPGRGVGYGPTNRFL